MQFIVKTKDIFTFLHFEFVVLLSKFIKYVYNIIYKETTGKFGLRQGLTKNANSLITSVISNISNIFQ